jgi:hypothetical protein
MVGMEKLGGEIIKVMKATNTLAWPKKHQPAISGKSRACNYLIE